MIMYRLFCLAFALFAALFVVAQPCTFTPAITPVGSGCGQSNGHIAVSISGTTGPYTMQWENMAGTLLATGDSLLAQPAGVYRMRATDSLGCTLDTLVVLPDFPGPVAGIDPQSVAPADCYGTGTGSATVVAVVGTGAYSYEWVCNNIPVVNANGATATNLPAGLVVVSVTDQANCKTFAWTVIGQPDSISVSATVTDVHCFGANDGTITAVATGGSGLFTYQWSGPETRVGSTITDLEPGIWTVVVADSNGCTKSVSWTITEPNVLTSTNTPTVQNTNSTSPYNGRVTIFGKDGTSPYTYKWFNCRRDSIGNTQFLDNVAADTFIVKIMDAKGCSFTKKISIKGKCASIADSARYCLYSPLSNGVYCQSIYGEITNVDDVSSLNFYLAPNPARTCLSLSLDLASRDNVNISIVSMDGKVVFRRAFGPVMAVYEAIPVESFARGTYLVRVTTSQGEASRKLILE